MLKVVLMLYGLLNTLFVILCFLSVLIILLQKSKGSLGIIGSAGSGAQMLFGGTGGQDIFQKITWTFVALFLSGSLVLAILKNKAVYESRYLSEAPQSMSAEFALPETATEEQEDSSAAPEQEQTQP